MHILLVDDKKTILDSLSLILEKAGHTIVSAINGLDGFDKAQKESFDLYIIDHLMPLVDGIQLTKNLNNLPSTSTIPIIFMTTQDTTDTKIQHELASFFSIVSKPIDEKAFIQLINQLSEKNTARYSL
jgi:CheY-like chemotaxis protein